MPSAVNYPRRVELGMLPTPLQYLERASERWGRGHRLWIKRDDLSGSLLSGNKIRKLEFIAAHAQDNDYDTLITCGGVQSNHCRATALVGAQLGLSVHLLLRGQEPQDSEGNYLLDQLAGATIECLAPSVYFTELDDRFTQLQAKYAAQGRKALAVPTGGSDGLGIWGYVAAVEELKADFTAQNIERAHIVTATGSGGTQAGLTLGCALHDVAATVWGVNVCDDEQYFIDKVHADHEDWLARGIDLPSVSVNPRVLDGYVGDGYGIASSDVFEYIAELASLEGIVLDPVYTGKAFQGMVAEIESGRFEGTRDIVFVHTGGIFGLFPQRSGLNAILG